MNIDTCPRCHVRLQKVKCKSGFYYRHYGECTPTVFELDEIFEVGELNG